MSVAEQRYLRRADHVLAVSETDRSTFGSFLDLLTSTSLRSFKLVLMWIISNRRRTWKGAIRSYSLVLWTGCPTKTGSSSLVYPGDSAPLLLIRHIRQLVPDVSLRIVGRKPSADLESLAARTGKR
jgi:hypothetical protein